eukprot:scaffold76220_cov72-Phaeocystis_antarctica.AAC.1
MKRGAVPVEVGALPRGGDGQGGAAAFAALAAASAANPPPPPAAFFFPSPFILAANAMDVIATSTSRTVTAVVQAICLNSSKVIPVETSSNLPVRL